MVSWQSIMSEEYGITPDVSGARAWTRISRVSHVSEHAPRIPSAGLYVGICRRLDWSLRAVDGRVLAAGWNHYSPTEWIGRGRDQAKNGQSPVDSFIEYWNATQERPGIAGSCYNSQPEDVFALWRARVSVRDTRRIGANAAMAIVNGHVHWKLVRRAIRRWRAEERACAIEYSREQYERRLSPKAWAALGRVSVEMQEAVLAELRRRPPNPTLADGRQRELHASELPWEAAALVQQQLLDDMSGRLRVALARGKRQTAMLVLRIENAKAARKGQPSQDKIRHIPTLDSRGYTDAIRWLCPAYPQVSIEQACRLCRGESPIQLSDNVLTRHEAHAWLSTMPTVSPVEYLVSTLPHCPAVRSVVVARWLMSIHQRGRWSALTRERDIVGPGGQHIRIRYLDRIDEIQDEDLDRGTMTGIDRTFTHAAKRAGEAWLDRARRDHRVLAQLPRGWRLYRCMRHLCTPSSLAREGDEMQHCVGSYVSAVERGQSVILAIQVLGHRSTVELSPSGSVLQHRGECNSDPHPLCYAVLDRFLARNGLRARRAA